MSFRIEFFTFRVTDPTYGGGYVWQKGPAGGSQAVAASVATTSSGNWQSTGQPPTAFVDPLGDVQIVHGALTIPDEGLEISVSVTFWDPHPDDAGQVIELDGVRVTVERIS